MSDEIDKEIIYEFETCISKDSYMKPIYGKISRKHIIPRRILTLLMIGEVIALIFLDRSYMWIILLIVIFYFSVLNRILLHISAKKQYEKICATKENSFTYTFYKDRAKIKSPTVEATLNYDTAEFFAENDERLIIVFPFNRTINIEKSQCDEEQLAFFRKIVPEENQKKTENKAAKNFFVVTFLMVLYTVVLAITIAWRADVNSHTYYPEYPATTYVSFEACLDAGTVDDIVIINNRFIEYTFFGRGEDERYYTVYSGDDIAELTEKLDSLDVRWKLE